MSPHLPTVQDIYAAFGRGDVPAILAHVSPEVDWEYGPRSMQAPWLRRGRGVEGAVAFFQAVGQHLDIQRFVVKELFASEQTVLALVDIEFVVRGTGMRVQEEDEVHVWRFDEQGKIIRFRHVVDSVQHEAAARGL